MANFNNDSLPVEYVLEKFYTHAGNPVRVGNKYNASCPICREGDHWLKRKRLYYHPATNSFNCFNCIKSWSAFWWVKLVTGMEPKAIWKEARAQYGDEMTDNGFYKKMQDEEDVWSSPELPTDAINLFNPDEVEFYKSNKRVKAAVNYITKRGLTTAINKPKAIYFTLNDKVHRNRILLPFYDADGQSILFYQTRVVISDDSPKYISKINADKTIFGLDKINPKIPYIFAFEGPVDSTFVENGVGMAGINYTIKQQQQLKALDGYYKVIWVIDNPAQDKNVEVYDKILELIDRGETIFCWPKEFAQYKDMNDICMDKGISGLPYQIILKFAKSGYEAKLALAASRG